MCVLFFWLEEGGGKGGWDLGVGVGRVGLVVLGWGGCLVCGVYSIWYGGW